MSGYRGYITSRPLFGGDRAPQHIQNIVLRSHAQRKKLTYLLSAVEYTMPNCYQILMSVLDELPKLDGVLAYSLFMLPEDDALEMLKLMDEDNLTEIDCEVWFSQGILIKIAMSTLPPGAAV